MNAKGKAKQRSVRRKSVYEGRKFWIACPEKKRRYHLSKDRKEVNHARQRESTHMY